MLKKRLIGVVVGIALLAAVAGSSGIAADALGLHVTAQAHACQASGTSGGGC